MRVVHSFLWCVQFHSWLLGYVIHNDLTVKVQIVMVDHLQLHTVHLLKALTVILRLFIWVEGVDLRRYHSGAHWLDLAEFSLRYLRLVLGMALIDMQLLSWEWVELHMLVLVLVLNGHLCQNLAALTIEIKTLSSPSISIQHYLCVVHHVVAWLGSILLLQGKLCRVYHDASLICGWH